MTIRPFTIICTALALGSTVIGIAVTAPPARAQILSGFDLFRSNCDGCHELPDPEEQKRPRKDWESILTRMVKQRGATLNDKEFAAVLTYLDSFNRPKREVQWVETSAKSHKAAFAAEDSGKLPADWVDLTVGGDEQVPWAVQGDTAARTFYLSPLKSAGENQFPILIDNTGVVRNGGATARLQLVSGKGAVGAGLVFGFRNPQTYFGVRISPKDVVLYEVQGGQRALLGRAPVALALKQWHTLGVDLGGTNVTVSLNGKAMPLLSKALPGYQGGRVGIHTQGDTVALFDQWQVTVK